MDKKLYVVSGIGPDLQASRALGSIHVSDGSLVYLTAERAKEINAVAKAYEKRAAARGVADPRVLRVKKASARVVVAVETEAIVEEITAEIDSRTPDEIVEELAAAHGRSGLEELAEELGIEQAGQRSKFPNKKALAAEIVGHGYPTQE
jgi:alkanesulfonate monooxygenase SsuD/methylene tetrahydromethanopterin reductase-like flavin-dependent oxidoreductase (luciferase family)